MTADAATQHHSIARAATARCRRRWALQSNERDVLIDHELWIDQQTISLKKIDVPLDEPIYESPTSLCIFDVKDTVDEQYPRPGNSHAYDPRDKRNDGELGPKIGIIEEYEQEDRDE
ncbi:hypothetical protein VPH35_067732 [Triticum aestivum]